MKIRIFIALSIGILTMIASLLMLSTEAVQILKPKFYLINAIFLPVIAISLNIKGKSDNLNACQGLMSKDMQKITSYTSEFGSRIWSIWFLLFSTFSMSILFSNIPLSKESSQIFTSFLFAAYAICTLVSTSLFSIDQSIQVLSTHLKTKAMRYEEKKNALKLLDDDSELSSKFKEYASKHLGEKN
ncbi:hypothetical protein A1OO_08735 [Enterovibrio norvegicus FF-33]|uniref:hypothetical protein n=1 Tax=Enterovibrio norvegicus TaxID=188144 RepID=UPI000370E4B9|nr:hypothetical protein [Enterovibrio norvegicus]OEE65885.1 hypothetical protein A1OO_08735 [Enterovibrio norvegicus FF-33]